MGVCEGERDVEEGRLGEGVVFGLRVCGIIAEADIACHAGAWVDEELVIEPEGGLELEVPGIDFSFFEKVEGIGPVVDFVVLAED